MIYQFSSAMMEGNYFLTPIHMKTFEDYLYDYYVENKPQGVLDDDLHDSFIEWMGDLDGEDYLELGDDYGKFLMKNK